MANMANYCTFVPAEPGPSVGNRYDHAIDEMKAVLDGVDQTTTIYDVKRKFERICEQHGHPFGREIVRARSRRGDIVMETCIFCHSDVRRLPGPRTRPRSLGYAHVSDPNR